MLKDITTKKGFKQTEVGNIPIDWELKTIVDISTLKARIGWQGLTTKEYLNNGEYFLVTGTDFINGKVAWDTCHYVEKERYVQDRNIQLRNQDILITKDGTIGKVAFVENLTLPATLNSGVFVIRPKENNYVPSFLFYIFNSIYFKNFLNELVAGSTINHLYQKDFVTFKFPLPSSKSEQSLISTVLGDTDSLINSLEKLVAKKRMIKQGVMQRLLTPKKSWKVKEIGELGKPYGGLSGKSKIDFEKGKFPYIPFMNIMSNPVIDTNYFDYVNISPNESQHIAIKGDLFFNGSSETPEEVGMCSVLLNEIPNLYLNSFCFGFRLNKELKTDGLYLSYFFRSSEGRKLFYSLAQGATRYNLSKSNFVKMKIALPEPKEQIQIATILYDIDLELSKFEKELEKYKMIKQGMMQQLLTGKIRINGNS